MAFRGLFGFHQGSDFAFPELGGVSDDDRLEFSCLGESPESRSAGGEHLDYLRGPKQAFLWLLNSLPELGRGSAAGQNGLPVIQGKGMVEFQGGFYEAMDGGKHRDLLGEKVRDRQGAGTTKSERDYSCPVSPLCFVLQKSNLKSRKRLGIFGKGRQLPEKIKFINAMLTVGKYDGKDF